MFHNLAPVTSLPETPGQPHAVAANRAQPAWRARWVRRIFVAALAVLGASNLPGQNLVTNGDFEIPPFNSEPTVPNWTVSGSAHVAQLVEGATGGTHSAALSVGGDSEGNVLSQTIATTPGQSYILEFDGGVFGIADNTLQLQFEVLGNTSRLAESRIPPVFNTFDPAQVEFHHFFRTFTADSAQSTLRFTDIGLGNVNADIVVDSVSVIVTPSPTPAPTPTNLPLVNGDFEAWPFNDPGTVSGWTLGGTKHAETIDEGSTSSSHSAGFSVGFDSNNTTLSQTFITTANQTYTLDFDAGVFGQRSGTPLQLQAQVFGNTMLLNTVVTPPDAFTFHPVFVTFQHYHYTFVADTNLATIQFTDPVGQNLNADLVLDTVSIVPQAPTFAEWQAIYFTPAQRADPTISGWNADPDQDGIANGLEYFFHMNPLVGVSTADQLSLPRVSSVSDGGSTYATFTYHRLLGWPGNPPVVAVSHDLVNWDTTQSEVEQVGAPGRADGFMDVVTVQLKTPLGPSGSKVFFRLLLSQ